jgi:hypothetical protein
VSVRLKCHFLLQGLIIRALAPHAEVTSVTPSKPAMSAEFHTNRVSPVSSKPWAQSGISHYN